MENSKICTSALDTTLSTVREIAVTNKEAGLLIGLSIAITIVLYGGAKAAEIVIKAWRK
ncbi:MAG: hypothetical protein AAGA60_19780 [Cyanobacteria bacterium P01_E01_bin.42]